MWWGRARASAGPAPLLVFRCAAARRCAWLTFHCPDADVGASGTLAGALGCGYTGNWWGEGAANRTRPPARDRCPQAGQRRDARNCGQPHRGEARMATTAAVAPPAGEPRAIRQPASPPLRLPLSTARAQRGSAWPGPRDADATNQQSALLEEREPTPEGPAGAANRTSECGPPGWWNPRVRRRLNSSHPPTTIGTIMSPHTYRLLMDRKRARLRGGARV